MASWDTAMSVLQAYKDLGCHLNIGSIVNGTLLITTGFRCWKLDVNAICQGYRPTFCVRDEHVLDKCGVKYRDVVIWSKG